MKSFRRSCKWNEFAVIIAALGSCWSGSAASAPAESVVTIYTQSRNSSAAQGTGFVIGSDGRIATAYHVIQHATKIELIDKDFRRLDDVLIEWIDPRRDIAILRSAGARNLPALQLASQIPRPQEEIRVVGSPRGLPQQVLFGRITSAGYVSSLAISSAGGHRVFAESIDVLPIDITIYSGMSGAPVLSNSGSVIGILSGSYDENRGIGWAIPSKYVDNLASQPAQNKRPEQMWGWPELTLMSKRWVSLKRSYSKPFAAEHIAQLESLEVALTTLRGMWNGDAEDRTVVYDDHTLGRCERHTLERYMLRINGVDADAARIAGRQSREVHVQIKFTHPSWLSPFDNEDLRRQREGFCSDRIFGDKLIVERAASTSGDFLLEARFNKPSPDKPTFYATIDTTDCAGSACNANVYGKKTAGRLDFISSSKVRWRGAILQKW